MITHPSLVIDRRINAPSGSRSPLRLLTILRNTPSQYDTRKPHAIGLNPLRRNGFRIDPVSPSLFSLPEPPRLPITSLTDGSSSGQTPGAGHTIARLPGRAAGRDVKM
ncbi:MAG: hypothetical protein O3A37_11825 [Planctomycetota bacterium]|nr:hypothetical protein [Planctomycetota bacterium]